MKNTSVHVHVLSLALAVLASLTLLVTGAAAASAAPSYPPTTVCSSHCARSVDDTRTAGEARSTRDARSEQTGTASTGFATLTASVIAAALLVGGAGLVLAGRRRRHG